MIRSFGLFCMTITFCKSLGEAPDYPVAAARVTNVGVGELQEWTRALSDLSHNLRRSYKSDWVDGILAGVRN